MALLNWSAQARVDVDDIYDFIARQDRRPLTADRAVQSLEKACEGYAEAFAAGSSIGTRRPTLGEGYRIFSHKRWVVVFRPAVDGIEVMRVVDGSRDYSRLFRE
jgi:plasmid stabilization system protein ParE